MSENAAGERYWRATTWHGRTVHLMDPDAFGKRAICGRYMHVRVEPGNGYDDLPECSDCRRHAHPTPTGPDR